MRSRPTRYALAVAMMLTACGGPPVGLSTGPAGPPPPPPSVITYGGGHEVGATLSRLTAFSRGIGPPLDLRGWVRSVVAALDDRATIDGDWRFVVFNASDGERAFALFIPRSGAALLSATPWRWDDLFGVRIALRSSGNHLVLTTSPTWVDGSGAFVGRLLTAPIRGDVEARWPLARHASDPDGAPLFTLPGARLGAGPRWLQSRFEQTLRQLKTASVSAEFTTHALSVTATFETQRGSQAETLLQFAGAFDPKILRGVPIDPPALLAGQISGAGWRGLDRLLRAAAGRAIATKPDRRAALMHALGGGFFVSLQGVGPSGELALFGVIHPTEPDRLRALMATAPTTPSHTAGDHAVRTLEIEGELLHLAELPDGVAFAVGAGGRAVLDGVLSGRIDHGLGANTHMVAALSAAAPGVMLLLTVDALDLMRLFGNRRLSALLAGLGSDTMLSVSAGAKDGALHLRLHIPRDQLGMLLIAALRIWRERPHAPAAPSNAI